MKPRVFVTRALPGLAVDQLIDQCELDIWPEDSPPPREEIFKRVKIFDCLQSLVGYMTPL